MSTNLLCPTGSQAISGGYRVRDGAGSDYAIDNIIATESQRGSNNREWLFSFGEIEGGTTSDWSVDISVLCATVSS